MNISGGHGRLVWTRPVFGTYLREVFEVIV